MLKQEAGGHRVQRLSKGRTHSSTVTVSVLSSKNVSWSFDESEFEKEWFSGSGAGGQHRNKHQNALRLRHIPTNTIVTAQCRKRPQSEAQAFAQMKERLQSAAADETKRAEDATRRRQVGTGQKADKRRTYRFQDNTTRDHLSGEKAPTDKVLKGRFELIWRSVKSDVAQG